MHANPADPRPILLSGDNHQGFLEAEPAGQSLLQTAHIAFLHFDSAGQQVAPRSYQGAAQFMQPWPGGLITLQPEYSLQPQCTGAVLLGGPTTWRGTRLAKGSGGPERSFPPSPKFGSHNPHTATALLAPVLTAHPRNGDRENHPPSQPRQFARHASPAPKFTSYSVRFRRVFFCHARILHIWWGYLSKADTHLRRFQVFSIGLVGIAWLKTGEMW